MPNEIYLVALYQILSEKLFSMEIQEIKIQLTLAQVFNYYHLKPDKNQRLNCPFHEDKTPSLQVYYKTHSCYCFSSNCKTHGKAMDVIDFIMHKESVSGRPFTKHEAILKAKEMIGGGGTVTPINTLSKTAILTKVFTYFKNGVHSSKPAKAYLESRSLDFTKTEVGYNSGQFHYKLSGGDEAIKQYVKCGLLLELGFNSRFGKPAHKPFGKQCVAFSLRNPKNEIVSLYFRSILGDKKQRHFYLKGREGLYPKYPPAETKKLILTESIIDAASLMEQQKIKNKYEILSLYGTNGLTKEHTVAVSHLKELDEIIFFLNGDPPGIKAVEKYAPMLKGMLPKVKITSVEVPENEDVNSLLQSHSPEILIHLIDTRKEYTFLFSVEKSIEKETQQNSSSPRLFTPTKEEQSQAVKRLVQESQGGQQHQEVKEERPSKTGLNTTNPYNLKYSSSIANYQIKGFRMSQPDSLKVTLNIATK